MYKSPRLLLIEDDHVDIMAIQRALLNNSWKRIDLVNNGEEAILYLEDKNKPLPICIIMDINMPRMNGFEFLDYIKKNKKFNNIPIIVMSSTQFDEELLEKYKNIIQGFIRKDSYNKFADKIRIVYDYWDLMRWSALEKSRLQK